MTSKNDEDYDIFSTRKVFTFRGDGDVLTLVAYQINGHGSQRLALVGERGETLAHGYSGVYQHPVFATFGTQKFLAFTPYFEGEIVEPAVVYRLEEGGYAGDEVPMVEEDCEGDEDDR